MYKVFRLFHAPKQPVQRFFVAKFPLLSQAQAFAEKQPFSTLIE